MPSRARVGLITAFLDRSVVAPGRSLSNGGHWTMATDPRMNDTLETLDALGISLPSPAYLIGVIVFSVVGIVGYYYGKRHGRQRMRWLGLALMLYPYVVWQTWLLYVVGVGLSIAIWFERG